MSNPRVVPFSLDRMRHLNYTWFSPGATRFFQSRYPRRMLETREAIWFVASSAVPHRGRRWSVHRLNLSDRSVDTIGEIHAYASGGVAWNALLKAEEASRAE